MAVCTSCGRETNKYSVLSCPSKDCNGKITRCQSCRINENKYVCTACSFSGP